MKTTDIVRLIDKLIEKRVESIRKSIKQEIYEEVNRTMGKLLVEVLKDRNSTVVPRDTQVEPRVKPLVTNNPRLNSVLAETARNYRPLQKTSDSSTSLAELLDSGFDKIGSNEDVSYEVRGFPQAPTNENVSDGANIGFLKQIVSEGVTNGPPQQSVLGTSAVPDILKGVFKRDFRDVMKKMDEQKKYGSQGLINPNTVFSG